MSLIGFVSCRHMCLSTRWHTCTASHFDQTYQNFSGRSRFRLLLIQHGGTMAADDAISSHLSTTGNDSCFLILAFGRIPECESMCVWADGEESVSSSVCACDSGTDPIPSLAVNRLRYPCMSVSSSILLPAFVIPLCQITEQKESSTAGRNYNL